MSDVVDISTRLAEAPPIELLQDRYDACRHPHIVVDPRHRVVACSDCGREPLDPIEVLLELARTWSRWRYEYQRLIAARTEEERRRREGWERQAERHLRANPTHRLDPERRGWTAADCRTCSRLEIRGRTWLRAIVEVPRGADPS